MSDALRDMAERFLLTACSVLQPSETADGAGGRTRVWVVRETTKCRLEAVTSSVDVPASIVEKLGGRQPYRFSLPHDTTLQDGDSLMVNARTFDVLTVQRPTTPVLVRGLCVEVV